MLIAILTNKLQPHLQFKSASKAESMKSGGKDESKEEEEEAGFVGPTMLSKEQVAGVKKSIQSNKHVDLQNIEEKLCILKQKEPRSKNFKFTRLLQQP